MKRAWIIRKRVAGGFLVAFVLGGALLSGLVAQRKMVIMPAEMGIARKKKEPFTAAEVTTLTQTTPDGRTVTRVAEDRIARDSKGRVFKEQHLPWTVDANNPIYYINILDPVARLRIHIDPQRNIAMKGPIEEIYQRDYDPYADNLSQMATHVGESIRSEKLGTQQIAGLSCWGVRTTHIVPAGMYGNNPAMTIVDEFWYSDKLGIDVRRHRSDPRSGEPSSELRDVVLTEPPAEMFVIPPSYVVEPTPQPPKR
jgi:hypothetical protein